MTITPETTLADLGRFFTENRLSLRVCHLGTGYIVFLRGGNSESLGYGRDLPEAIEHANKNRIPHAAPIFGQNAGER